jgi:hypothetical protein
MSHVLFLCFLSTLITTATFSSAQGQEKARRPNVLLIIPDQLRAQALGCMGNGDVRKPNLDRLASQGVPGQW